MKRRQFIKAFAAACCVPVVAAKAIASSHKKKGILDLFPGATAAYSLRNLRGGVMCEDDVFIAHYDHSGNGNHLIKTVWFDGQGGQVKMK